MMKKLLKSSAARYLVVGILSLGVDYFLLLFLYRLVGLDLVAATSIAFMTAFAANFMLNKQWSFNAASGMKNSIRQIVLYSLLVVVNLLFTNLFIVYLNTLSIGPEFSKPVATAIITILNFFMYRAVIFKQAPETTAD